MESALPFHAIKASRIAAIVNHEIGGIHHARKRYSRAITRSTKAIKHDPGYAYAYSNRGLCYQHLGQHNEAIEDFSVAARLDSNLAIAFYNRGISHKLNGALNPAIDDFDRAISLNRNDVLAYSERGVTHYLRGDHARALKDHTASITACPTIPYYRVLRGYVHFNMAEFQHAADDLAHAISIKHDPGALLYYSLSIAHLESLDAAAQKIKLENFVVRKWPFAMLEFYFDRRTLIETLAEAKSPTEQAETQFFLGQWHLLHNNAAEATTAFLSTVENSPVCFIEHASATAALKRMGYPHIDPP